MERSELLEENDKVNAVGKLPAQYENVLLGITKASLSTDSFIVGRLIPGGTGLAFHRARKEKEVWEAEERQALLQQEKANMAAELQAMEDQQNDTASVEQYRGKRE